MEKIKYLVMDVDGTMTDGKIYMGENGEIMKAFNIKDGYAISHILPKHGIIPIVITGRMSKIVEIRCRELGIKEVHQGCLDKKAKLIEILDGFKGNEIRDIAFIGDDILDLPLVMEAAMSGCPCDACEEIRQVASYVCNNKGGEGAVREFIDWIIKQS